MNERDRASLYRSIARLSDAGLGSDALWASLRSGHEGLRPLLASLESASRTGQPLSGALAQLPGQPFPSHELALLRAAEHTGTVGDALHQLADDLETRRRSGRVPKAGALYALALLHGAVLAPNAGLLYADFWSGLGHVLTLLVPLDLGVAGVWYALSRPTHAPGLARLALWIPGLRAVQIHAGYRAWFAGMHLLHASGVSLAESSRESLAAVPNPVLRQRLAQELAPLERHKPLGDVIPRLPWLGAELRMLLSTAETSGDLEAALLHASAREAAAEAAARLRFGRVASATAGALAVVYVAARLVLFYAAHFSRLLS